MAKPRFTLQQRGSQGGPAWNSNEFYHSINPDFVPGGGDLPQATGPSAADRLAANRQHALDLTEGRGNALMDDPRITAALDVLQQNAQEGPYSAGVVNQLANRQADANATIAGNQSAALRQQLANRGGNPNDPSFTAALNAADTARMQANNAGRGDIESRATLENYGARGQAAQALAGTRLGQTSQANNQFNQAANLYANEQIDSGGRQSTVPSFAPSFSSGSRSGGSSYQPIGQGSTFDFSDYFGADESPQPTPVVPPPRQPPVTRPPGYTDLRTGQYTLDGQTGQPMPSGARNQPAAPVATPATVRTPWTGDNTPAADAYQYSGQTPWGTPAKKKTNPYQFSPEF